MSDKVREAGINLERPNTHHLLPSSVDQDGLERVTPQREVACIQIWGLKLLEEKTGFRTKEKTSKQQLCQKARSTVKQQQGQIKKNTTF